MTTNEVRISGASDDLIEVDGYISEEYSKPEGRWVGKLTAPNGDGLLVTANYLNPGVWAIGVAPVDEAVFLPDWPLALGNAADCDYSAQLTVTVPPGTVLVEVDD